VLAWPCGEARSASGAQRDAICGPAGRRVEAPAGEDGLASVYKLETIRNGKSNCQKLLQQPASGKTGSPAHRTRLSSALQKRRVFSAEEKARIVAESFESGQSVCSVARKHRLTASQLFAWRKAARLWRGQGPGDPGALRPQAASDFGKSQPSSAGESSPIEIAIGTAIVRVWRGADAALLKEVVQVLSENLQSGTECALPRALHNTGGEAKARGSAAERAEKLPNELSAIDIANSQSMPGMGLTWRTS
jgi:transposase